jgi:hypothetical protein
MRFSLLQSAQLRHRSLYQGRGTTQPPCVSARLLVGRPDLAVDLPRICGDRVGLFGAEGPGPMTRGFLKYCEEALLGKDPHEVDEFSQVLMSYPHPNRGQFRGLCSAWPPMAPSVGGWG